MENVEQPEAPAAAPAGPWDSLQGGMLDLLDAGGPVVAILLVMSVAALAIVLSKLWQFRQARLGDVKTARSALGLYRAGRGEEALVLLRGAVNPVAWVLSLAVRGQQRGIDEAKLREELTRCGGEALESLRGLLRPLEVIASLAPLLGLFGTVLGMIEAFQRLSEAGSRVDPSILSGGIWEALLTTAVGLAVAIPSVAVHNWLERRVDRVAFEMDSVVTQVFTEDLTGESPAGQETRNGKWRHEPSHLRAAVAATGE